MYKTICNTPGSPNISKSKLCDYELINLINEAENESLFTILYDKYWTLLIAFAGNYIDDYDTCKEIVQELFITLHEKRSHIKVKVSFSSYLYSSLRNSILNYIRNR